MNPIGSSVTPLNSTVPIGTIVMYGGTIDSSAEARLVARPEAAMCIDCARSNER